MFNDIKSRENRFFKIKRKKFLIELSFLIIIISSNFVLIDYLRENVQTWRIGDEYMHVSIANSFRENRDFQIDFLRGNIFEDSTSFQELIKNNPTVEKEQRGKGPLFYVFMGTFFDLTDATYGNLYQYASIFNSIVGSAFLILFFFFVEKRFGLKIAISSTVIVALTPYLLWESTRVLPHPLLYVFSLAAIFFLQKRNLHYFLFGFFVGIAHLTHPFAIFLGVTYSIFLLLNREFKGFLITILTWHIILIPWFLRNYYYFKDIGAGLYIPFSDKVSSLLTFLPTESTITISQRLVPVEPLEAISNFGPFTTLSGMFEVSLRNLYHMEYLFYFLLIISVLAFLNLDKFKKLKMKSFWFLIPLVAAYIFAVLSENNLIQIFFTFIIPLVLIYVFYKKCKDTFLEKQIPRLWKFIVLFAFINLIGYYYTALLYQRTVPETHQIMFAVFLAVPLSFFGFYKLIKQIQIKFDKRVGKFIAGIIVVLVFSPIIIQFAEGIDRLDNYQWPTDTIPKWSDNVKKINEIMKNQPQGTIVASNDPPTTFLETGFNSISIPPDYFIEEFDDIIEYYDISYLVFYDTSKKYWGEGTSKYRQMSFDQITSYDPQNFYFKEEKNVGDSYLFKVIHIMSSDINEPEAYLLKGEKIFNLGEEEKAQKIFLEVVKLGNTEISLKVGEKLMLLKRYDNAIPIWNGIIEKDPKNLVANYLLFVTMDKVEKIKNTEFNEKFVDFHVEVLSSASSDKKLKFFNFINEISEKEEMGKYTGTILETAQNLEHRQKYGKTLVLYDIGKHFNLISEESTIGKYNLLVKTLDYEGAINEIDDLIEFSENRMKAITDSKMIQANIAELISLLKEKASLLIQMEEYNGAFYAYNKILGLNKFDIESWLYIADYYYENIKLKQALNAYEHALQLDQENNYALKRIEELKAKISNLKN